MTDIRRRESIDTYLSMCALVAEGRRDDAFKLITSLPPEEQIDMWIAGCSITYAFATEVAGHNGITPEQIPAWLRIMTTFTGDEDTQ